MNSIFHGIILNESLENDSIIETFSIFAKKEFAESSWVVYGVELDGEDLENVISRVRSLMKSDGKYFNHFYSETELIIVFKNKIFRLSKDNIKLDEVIAYGKNLGIPIEQLDFIPHSFEDEIKYFQL